MTEDVPIPPKSLLVGEEVSQDVEVYSRNPGDAGGDECDAPWRRSHRAEATGQDFYASSRRGSLLGCWWEVRTNPEEHEDRSRTC